MIKYLLLMVMMCLGSFSFADEDANGKVDMAEHYIHDALYITDSTGFYVSDAKVMGVAPGMPYSVIEYTRLEASGWVGLIPLTPQMGTGANFIRTGEWISWYFTEALYHTNKCLADDWAIPQFYEKDVVFRRVEGIARNYIFVSIDRDQPSNATTDYYLKISNKCYGPYTASVPLVFYPITEVLEVIPELILTISSSQN